jgi:hypothetical protein
VALTTASYSWGSGFRSRPQNRLSTLATRFPQALHTNAELIPQEDIPQPRLSALFPINYSFIIPSPNAIHSLTTKRRRWMSHKSIPYNELCGYWCCSVCSRCWQNFVTVFNRSSLAHLRCLWIVLSLFAFFCSSVPTCDRSRHATGTRNASLAPNV